MVRPTKSFSDTDSLAVCRKMKDKTVSMDDLIHGTQELGVVLDYLIEFVAESLKLVAGELGLTPRS